MGKLILNLNDIKLFGFHGIMLEENLIGSHYSIDVEVELDADEASENDDLSKTVNYVDLYRIIKEEMNTKSKLIENLAKRIIKRFQTFKKLKYTKIKICKKYPPIGGPVGQVCVVLED
ncbi:dihydroneopterin aldolase [Blattabacterium cuenoti]|uniref:dihydroneopterin aldolase n=1 Tax=Blattabacterium cuenoti TaxID=1653831 RepID=UPI00163BDFB5|nr:dihydroneopterin aldolase [Blattabacterium cuenoti]